MRSNISRRKFIGAVGAIGMGLTLCPNSLFAESANKRPNIIYIMADDHTSQAWGCYNSHLSKYAHTPNIDRIRNEGALLTNSFCTNSICVPSRATILTGQYSHTNGATTLGGRIKPGQDNVAKNLQVAGYETAIIGKWHLKETPSGFDYFNVLKGQGTYNNPTLYESDADGNKKKAKTYNGQHSTDVITDNALAWLKNTQDKSKPYCMMIHFKGVHEPFYSADRFREMYKDIELPEPEDLLWEQSPNGRVFDGWPLEKIGERFEQKPSVYSPPVLKADKSDPKAYRKAVYQKFIKDYLRTVAGMDENIGRVLKYLDDTGQVENTVVIYTTDQGYFLGEHNLFDKRFFLEESLHMPFVIRYPKEIKPGTTVDDIIINVDFAELFLDYAGAKVPDSMQGKSFRQNLLGKTPTNWRQSMYYRYWINGKGRPAHYGIRTHTHKLIYYYGLKNTEKNWELYDLENDPHEYQNIYYKPENKELIEKLKIELAQVKREAKDMK